MHIVTYMPYLFRVINFYGICKCQKNIIILELLILQKAGERCDLQPTFDAISFEISMHM